MNRPNLRLFALALIAVGITVIAVSALRSRSEPNTELIEYAAQVGATTPAIQDSAIREATERDEPAVLEWEIVETLDHDSAAFTQGLEIANGRLFESTGLVGSSTLRELDTGTGETVRSIPLDASVFGEGLTVVDGEITVLTWQSGTAHQFAADTFAETGEFSYEGEGWGLCHDGTDFLMSDGSSQLTRRSSEDFAALSVVEVTFRDVPVEQINELECVNGRVFANIWMSNLIVRIDPVTGIVDGVADLSGLVPAGFEESRRAVLNGIAYDISNETFLVTGKLWPVTYRLQLNEQ